MIIWYLCIFPSRYRLNILVPKQLLTLFLDWMGLLPETVLLRVACDT